MSGSVVAGCALLFVLAGAFLAFHGWLLAAGAHTPAAVVVHEGAMRARSHASKMAPSSSPASSRVPGLPGAGSSRSGRARGAAGDHVHGGSIAGGAGGRHHAGSSTIPARQHSSTRGRRCPASACALPISPSTSSPGSSAAPSVQKAQHGIGAAGRALSGHAHGHRSESVSHRGAGSAVKHRGGTTGGGAGRRTSAGVGRTGGGGPAQGTGHGAGHSTGGGPSSAGSPGHHTGGGAHHGGGSHH